MRGWTWLCLIVSGVASAAPVSVTGDPVAQIPTSAGSGLCATDAVSTNPASDFPTTGGTFDSAINAFIDGASTRGSAFVATLDLANGSAAAGDFTTSSTSCPSAGCPFAIDDTTTAFATRLRGYLAVPAAGSFHLGAYADDAVAITVFDKAGTAYPIITRPPALGVPAWRSTNTVTFAQPGLYPIEILHAQIASNAVLEASAFAGTFTDFELSATMSTSLAGSGFALVPTAQLYTSANVPPSSCVQCVRGGSGSGSGSGSACGAGSMCSPAAICEPCSTQAACGFACQPCNNFETCVNIGGGSFECLAPPDDFPVDRAVTPDASTSTPAHSGGCCDGSGGGESAFLAVFVLAAIRRRATCPR